jgi:DNA mismatch endonuclease (patch repair protein)
MRNHRLGEDRHLGAINFALMERGLGSPAAGEKKLRPAKGGRTSTRAKTRPIRSAGVSHRGRSSKSEQMGRVRSKDTGPELTLRRSLTALGVRYRLHRRDLPGTPDVYISRLRLAVFVNGCFWHGHACPRGRGARTNAAFWDAKIDGNRARDQRVVAALRTVGVDAVTLWQCEMMTFDVVAAEIASRYRAGTRK